MGHKILLADDSITIQKVIELTFSDEDFELHTVGNGQKAIDEIRSVMPHVVLCDIIMPEKNGYEVCEFIKTSPDLKHIPVLLLTGAFEPFDQERAKAAGCEGFLAKPFEPQTLISRVKELLGSAPAKTAPAPTVAPTPASAIESEATLLVPPPASAPPTPSSGAQARTNLPPVPSEATSELEDAFAMEAGERELSLGPEDHTMLLGAEEGGARPGAVGTSDDDVWGEVAEESSAEEEDTATVFMAAPPAGIVSDGIESSGTELTRSDPDATWQLPNDDTPEDESADEGLTSGFQEFAAPSPPPLHPPQLPGEQTAEEIPDEPAFEPATAFEVDSSPESEMTSAFEPVDVEDYTEFEPIPEPPAPQRPAVADRESVAQETLPAGPVAPRAPENVSASTPTPPIPSSEPAAAPLSTHRPVGGSSFVGPDGVDEALVERVAQRVVDKLSAKVIQEIAWEVVPELAEGLIRKEIEVLKAKIPK